MTTLHGSAPQASQKLWVAVFGGRVIPWNKQKKTGLMFTASVLHGELVLRPRDQVLGLQEDTYRLHKDL